MTRADTRDRQANHQSTVTEEKTTGKQHSCSNACPWLSRMGMQSPSKTSWSLNEAPLQPYKYKYKWEFVERGLQIVQGR